MPTIKKCSLCEKEFDGRKNKKYCSALCRFRNWDKEHPRVKRGDKETTI